MVTHADVMAFGCSGYGSRDALCTLEEDYQPFLVMHLEVLVLMTVIYHQHRIQRKTIVLEMVLVQVGGCQVFCY